MTGQVKEEIIARFGELGVRVRQGLVEFRPRLLRETEFVDSTSEFDFVQLGGGTSTLELPPKSLAFTYCQTPIVYTMAETAAVTVYWQDGRQESFDGHSLDHGTSDALLGRSGQIASIHAHVVLKCPA